MEKKRIINRLFSRIERYLSKPKLNLLKTIYFNFRTMPAKVAIKLPVFIYGNVQFGNLSGRVEFRNCEVRRGMVTLGKCVDMFYPKGRSLIIIGESGKLIFEGICFFNTRFTIRIDNNASLILGDNVRIGSNVRICSQLEIQIGANTGITYNCEIMDTNFHYIRDRKNNRVKKCAAPIVIGISNWIGNNSQIMKGTKTNDFTTVAARSLLNRDYIKLYPDEEYIILAGMPAKLKSSGFQRIFSKEDELKINKYFLENSGEDVLNYYLSN